MIFFFKKNIKKSLFFSLCIIPGINKKKANNICKNIGFLKTTKWEKLTKNQQENFLFFLEKNSKNEIGLDFYKKITNLKKNILNLNNYKSIRIKKKLPVNGQRTKTNAKTSKKI